MVEVNGTTNIQDEDLICPITLGVFRDPVLAGDGHVYEREAITRWILEHGTSPFTREILRIDQLQPNDHLRHLATQRRNSTVSYNVRENIVTLPPLRRVPRNIAPVAPIPSPNIVTTNARRKIWIFVLFVVLIGLFLIIIGITFGLTHRSSNGNTNSTGFRLTTATYSPFCSPPLQARSFYAGSLTSNSSVFNRPRQGPVNGLYYYYQAIRVVVSVDGCYGFESNSSIDMYGYLYSSYFDSTNPNDNLLKYDDDSGDSVQFYLRSLLQSNNYTLVATTYGINVIGSFSITVTGPANVTLQ